MRGPAAAASRRAARSWPMLLLCTLLGLSLVHLQAPSTAAAAAAAAGARREAESTGPPGAVQRMMYPHTRSFAAEPTSVPVVVRVPRNMPADAAMASAASAGEFAPTTAAPSGRLHDEQSRSYSMPTAHGALSGQVAPPAPPAGPVVPLSVAMNAANAATTAVSSASNYWTSRRADAPGTAPHSAAAAVNAAGTVARSRDARPPAAVAPQRPRTTDAGQDGLFASALGPASARVQRPVDGDRLAWPAWADAEAEADPAATPTLRPGARLAQSVESKVVAPVTPMESTEDPPIYERISQRRIDWSLGIFAIIIIIQGIYLTFVGHRLVRIMIFLAGFYAGALIAYAVLVNVERNRGVPIDAWIWFIAILLSGILFGAMLLCLYRVGLFILGALLGLVIAIAILSLRSQGLIHSVAGRAAFLALMALAGGIAILFLERPVMIIATAVLGSYAAFYGIDLFAGTGFADALPEFLGAGNGYDLTGPVGGMLIGWLVFCLLGMSYQFYSAYRDTLGLPGSRKW
ncbi:hypothetical protein CXG81DRAFT_24359 [Caulochytrium protostelioides]|uniref:Transmembrane protein 198 n=1 Tax=Caulochytrium protostelioides TaxID=1555241 RepID=A0A4V1IV72_9FUNG|nr:hypothetical protein CXG81DRAFT_24359 [Caulochytrium protostelioides]|eukprot:RKP03049.1 hypothetical protein CXG81DRAFT_24359 [Caulochytrium protostelioides]